jgi:cell division protein FtsB
MAKNRKYQSAAIRFGPAIKAFLLCALIGGSGVGYVWQKSQIDQLGRQILKCEKRLAELQDQNEKLKKQLAFMRTPQFLEKRIRELNLGLLAPQPTQVWRLAEPLPGALGSGREQQYAQRAPTPALP